MVSFAGPSTRVLVEQLGAVEAQRLGLEASRKPIEQLVCDTPVGQLSKLKSSNVISTPITADPQHAR